MASAPVRRPAARIAVDSQVALGRRSRPDEHGLVRERDVRGARRPARCTRRRCGSRASGRRAHHAAGDLAAIGDQDLREGHGGDHPGLRFCRKRSHAFDALGPQGCPRERLGGLVYEVRRPRPARLAHQRLGGGQRRGRATEDIADDAPHGLIEARRGVNLMHQSDCERLTRVQTGAGDGQTLRLGIPQPLHEERRDLRRQHAERGFGQAEEGALRGDHHVRNAGHPESTTHHSALEHGDDGQPAAGEDAAELAKSCVHLHDRGRVLGEPRARACHVLEVGTRRKVTAGATQHDHPRRSVDLGGAYRIGDLADHRRGTWRCGPLAGSA